MTALNATPLPAPPPITRPILQPSVHARGGRPFVFAGKVDEWHAPGVLTGKPGAYSLETRCAADAAWLVEKVLGPARQRPHIWPGVPGAAERARQYGAWQRCFVGDKPIALRAYQCDGAAFLAERDYAILSDAPGIGKSCQALCAAEARLSLGLVPSPTTPCVLILAPALAKRHWQREIKRWTGYDAAILDGLRAEELPEARYIIANYDILFGARRKDAAGVVHDRGDLPGWGATLADKFLIVICDELHVLKGRSSRKAQEVRKVARHAPVTWGLTGTLVPNYMRDLWSPLDFLTGSLFGTYWDFAKKYCNAVQGAHGWDDHGASDLEELQGRLGFFVMGRNAAAVKLELPPMQRERYPIDVELTANTRHEGASALLDKGKAVGNALRRTATAKRPAVVEHALESLNAKQKVVVFLYMREQCDTVAKDIKSRFDGPVMAVHGDMTPEGRDKMATSFREVTGAAAFVATIDSVGMAISLVGADLVLFGDLVPEPWKMYQAELRCYRFDSVKSVLIRYLLATGTLDEHYAESVISKVENIEAVMGSGGDQGALATSLGGRSAEDIVEGLFSKLSAWKGSENA